jgi:hypothetical protein
MAHLESFLGVDASNAVNVHTYPHPVRTHDISSKCFRSFDERMVRLEAFLGARHGVKHRPSARAK